MGDYTLLHGDCLEEMAAMDAGSVDAVVTDPPYGLSKHRPQRVMDGLLRALSDIALPNLNETYAELLKQVDLAGISLDGSPLTRRKLASVDAGVGVPERAIDLDGGVVVRQVEVEASGESAVVATDVVLPNEVDAESGEFLGDYVLDLRDAQEASVRYGLGSRFAELGLGRVCVPVVLTFVPGGDQSLLSFLQSEATGWGHSIGLSDDASSESEGTSAIVAGARTVDRTMLRFDLSRGTLDLLATGSTGEDDRAAIQACPKLVGAGTATGGLSPELEPRRVGVVFDSANGTRPAYLHLWLRSGEDHRLESILPRGGFMGKSWDSVTPPADYWRAAYRVLQPSHYLLTFGGCRTHHRVMTAMEDAGFEIVDVLMYLFGSGFPKGRGQLKPAYEPVILARKPGPMRELGIEECRIGTDQLTQHGRSSDAFGFTSAEESGRAWSGRWPANLILECTCDETREGTAGRGAYVQPRPTTDAGGASWSKGEHVPFHYGDTARIHTDPNCPCAMLDGQTGTISPSFRKARSGNSAQGVTYSIGDDGQPFGHHDSGGASRFFYNSKAPRSERWGILRCDCEDEWENEDRNQNDQTDATSRARATCVESLAAGCASCIPSCGSAPTGLCPSGTPSTISTETNGTTDLPTSASLPSPTTSGYTPGANCETEPGGSPAASAGSSSRSRIATGTCLTKDGRNTDAVGPVISLGSFKTSECAVCGKPFRLVSHPTQKPEALMRWLVKLVARPGDVVLDPFMGSGTTGVACAMEGREFIGIEQSAEYIEIARRRIEAASAQGRLPLDESPPLGRDAAQ